MLIFIILNINYLYSGSGSQDADSDEEWPALGAGGAADIDTECDAEVVVDPDDEKAIEMFMNKNPPMRQDFTQFFNESIWDLGNVRSNICSLCFSVSLFRRTLADIIMEKITEKQTEVGTVMSEVSGCPMPQLDPRVTEVYRGVGKVRA